MTNAEQEYLNCESSLTYDVLCINSLSSRQCGTCMLRGWKWVFMANFGEGYALCCLKNTTRISCSSTTFIKNNSHFLRCWHIPQARKRSRTFFLFYPSQKITLRDWFVKRVALKDDLYRLKHEKYEVSSSPYSWSKWKAVRRWRRRFVPFLFNAYLNLLLTLLCIYLDAATALAALPTSPFDSKKGGFGIGVLSPMTPSVGYSDMGKSPLSQFWQTMSPINSNRIGMGTSPSTYGVGRSREASHRMLFDGLLQAYDVFLEYKVFE